MTKKIRVDFAWVSIDQDIWNLEILQILGRQLEGKISVKYSCKLLSVDFPRCSVDYEIPIEICAESIRDLDYRLSARDID